MISALRRRAGRHAKLDMSNGEQRDVEEVDVPTHFRCPISLDLMKDPVTLSTGMTYDRESIEKWIEEGNQRCPVTNQVLISYEQIPNHAIRKMIQSWCVENRSLGIERIPTPRIPVTPYQISEICAKISDATKRGDHKRCGDFVKKIKFCGRESERNKRCIARNGTGDVLSAAFESFAGHFPEKHIELLVDILSVLSWMFPIGKLGQAKLRSETSLNSIVWILKNGDLAARQSAVSTLKELLCIDISLADVLAETEGISDLLSELIREPICPASTRATLMAIHLMISRSSSCKTIVSSFIELGLVELLLEILFDAEKSISEKALCVLDEICSYEEGRDRAISNALTVPVLVKKILRVSDLATELSISVLSKLCKNHDNEKKDLVASVIQPALQMGAFREVLLVLQVGCGERMKGKVTELLKILNLHKDRVKCFDSSLDLKYLRRPF